MRKGARANSNVRAWAEVVPPDTCLLSVVSIAEIRIGIERVADSEFRRLLELWLHIVVRPWFGDRILAVDVAVLLTWRRLIVEGQKARYTYSQPDALIAATALTHGLGVVTRNAADFERAGVTLRNPWAEPLS